MLLMKVAQRIVFIDCSTVSVARVQGKGPTCILSVRVDTAFVLTRFGLVLSILDTISALSQTDVR